MQSRAVTALDCDQGTRARKLAITKLFLRDWYAAATTQVEITVINVTIRPRNQQQSKRNRLASKQKSM